MATKLLVCLVLIATASAVPLLRDDFESVSDVSSYKCARKCNDDTSKFKYKPSETYVYEYKADAETSMVGASEDKTKLQIETLANIEVISKCEFALRLQNVEIHNSGAYSQSQKKRPVRSYEFQRALTENTIRFSFNDGVIQDVCHPANERVWVLNFKRGLLSAFQNSMANLQKNENKTEVDIQGICKAEYKLEKEWLWERSIKVTKSKDLLACSNRNGLRTAIPMVPYDLDSPIQNLPLVKSSHECKHVISPSGILDSSSCKESHMYIPFSNGQSGGATQIEQTLTFKTVKNGIETSEDYIESRTNLLFHHVNGIDEVENSREAAEQKLKEICEQTKMDIRAETPRLFSELVHIVKVLKFSDIKSLYERIKNKELCMQNNKAMKFLLDTIPIAGTSQTVKMMAEIFEADTDIISDMEKRAWLISLSLIPEPSEDMLPALKSLLKGPSRELALLPVSALLKTMCDKNVDCEHNSDFQKIVQTITGRIDYYCNSDKTTKILTTLRAIGNIGHGKQFLVSLKTCLISQNAPLEYKVAAADAYRRFPCMDNEEKGPLFELYESQNSDPELRIMSFLSIMRCPRDSVLKKIIAQQDKEEDANVGTFVFTYLENLKESKDPHKKSLSQLVKRFNVRRMEDSGLKSSRCFEMSEVLNRINMGYVTDLDLIWSSSSVLPRAVRFNLTLPLFGKAFNVFDVGARMDGVESFIQKYFGEMGYFKQTESKDLEAFIYARVFGNEILFKNVRGTKQFEDMKELFDFDKILDKMTKENKYDLKISHTQQLIDTSLIIPTAIGLPMNLTVNSSVTVDIGAKNQIDLSGILARSKPIAVSTDVTASAGLEVTGSMMVDAFIYKHGLRMRNTLHSSVNFKSNLEVKKREIFSFEIVSPQEKQELFDARSQFFIVDNGYEKEQEMIKENRREMQSCTDGKFNEVMGIELCGQLQYPNGSMKSDAPYFPLTGPFRASVTLNKKDTQRSYRVLAKWVKTSKKLEAQVQIDTPGSRVDRHISADISIGNSKIKHVDVVLMSPWKKLVVNGKAAKNADLASLTGSVVVDDTMKYKLISELKKNRKGKRHEYLPFVEVENNGKRITLLAGSLVHNENKDISSDLEMNDLNSNPYTHAGKLVFSKQEKRLVFSIGEKNKKQFTVRMGSSLKKSGRNKQNIKMDPELLIETPRGTIVSLISDMEFQKKPLKVIGSMKLESIRMRKAVTLRVGVRQKKYKYPVSVKFSSPVLTGDIKGRVELRQKSYSSTMTLNYRGKTFKDTMLLSGKILDRSKNNYMDYKINSNMKSKKMPEYNTQTMLEITHKKATTADLTIYYGEKVSKKRVIQLSGSVNADVKDFKHASVKADVEARIPEKKVNMKMEIGHKHTPRLVDSEVKLRLAPFVKNDINTAIIIQNKGKTLYHMIAKGNLEVRGEKHSMTSELIQKSKKRFTHTLVVSSDDKEHKLVTVYRRNDNHHNINSDLESTELRDPVNISITADIKSHSNFHIQADVSENRKKIYSLDALSKLETGIAGRWDLEISHPKRTMKARASFNKEKNRLKTDVLVNWNVKSNIKPLPQIQYTGFYTQVSKPGSLLLKSNVKVVTPFKHFEKLSSNMNLDKSESKMKTSGRVSWGGIHKQMSSDLSVGLPLGMKNIKMSFGAKTPFRNYREIELEIDHELKTELKTLLKGKAGKDKGELILKGENIMDKYPWYNPGNLTGKLTLSRPAQRMETSFTYKTDNGQKIMKANFDGMLSKNRRISVDVNGAYHDVNDLSFDIDAKTPFRNYKKVGFEFKHKFSENQLGCKVIVVKNRAKTGFDMLLKDDQGEASAYVLLLLSPVYEKDVTLISKAQHKVYPMTASTQLSWAPYSTVNLSGSYKGETLNDLELTLKLTSPFENFENINLVASHVLDNSVKVMHLNIDYGIRKMIDVEIRSQNDEDLKLARVRIISPCPYFQNLNTGVYVNMRKGIRSKADLELELTPDNKYKGTVSLSIMKNDIVRGKFEMKTPVEGYRQLEGIVDITQGTKNGQRIASLTLRNDNDDIILFTAETEFTENEVNIKVTTKGQVLELLAKKLDEFDPLAYLSIGKAMKKNKFLKLLSLSPLLYKDKEGNLLKEIVMEYKEKNEDPVLKLDGSFTFHVGEKVYYRALSMRRAGTEIRDFDIDVSLTDGKKSVEGKVNLHVKLLSDIRVLAVFQDISQEKFGVEFNHVSNDDKFETSSKIYCFDLEMDFDFLMTDIKHVELKMKSRHQNGNNILSIRYIHEGQENRMSCSVVVTAFKDKKHTGINFIAESSPVHLFSLEFMFKNKKIIISGDYDETKINGLIMYGKKRISLTGVHDNFKNMKVTLKTPFQQLQMLSVNVNGEFQDGSANFMVKFNDSNQVDGQAALKYENPLQMTLTATMKSQIGDKQNQMRLEVETAQSPRIEAHLLFAVNDENKLIIDAHQRSDEDVESSNKLELELRYPDVGLKSKGIVLSLDGNKEKVSGNIQVLVDSGKALDADVDIDLEAENKAIIVVRKPKSMEYRFTGENFSISKGNELYFNWDRSDPNANLVVRGMLKDESNTYKVDRSLSLRLTFPSRSIGLEHSISGNKVEFHSSGKIYWSDDDESKLGYDFKVSDQSNRRRSIQDGEFKILLPSRTVGIYGISRDLVNQHDIETTFSWDLDNDDTKKIGVKAKLLKGAHTEAEVSLILPKNAHVDSTLVMNRGNTILEGKTQIFYSHDSRKTLTFFSKVEKKTGHHSFFYNEDKQNYSIEFGLQHPDSRVDLKLASYLGMDDERWTSSFGLDYLNTRRQNTNSALFVEINKLKKEINLITTSPYRTVRWTGGVVNEEPFELKAVKTIDNDEKVSAHLLVDTKKFNLDLTNEDRKVTFSAHYPNRTAFQFESTRQENSQVQQYFRNVIELVSPHVLETRIHWKPGMLVEIRDAVLDNWKRAIFDSKDRVDNVAVDIRREVARKHEYIAPTVFEEFKSFFGFLEKELVSVEQDIEQISQNLRQKVQLVNLQIGDVDLNEELMKLKEKLSSYLDKYKKLSKPVKRRYRKLVQAVEEKLNTLSNMPGEEFFNKTIRTLAWAEVDYIHTFFLTLTYYFHVIPVENLEEIWVHFEDFMGEFLDPQPLIKSLNKEIMDMWKSPSAFADVTIPLAPKIEMILKAVKEMVEEHPVVTEIVELLKDSFSQGYEQWKWAHNYWQVEENIPKRLEELAQLVSEIIETEVKENLALQYSFLRNPIRHFDPEEGELVAVIPLPVALDRLDKMPDFKKMSPKLTMWKDMDIILNELGKYGSIYPARPR